MEKSDIVATVIVIVVIALSVIYTLGIINVNWS